MLGVFSECSLQACGQELRVGLPPCMAPPPPLPVGGTSKVPAAAIGRGYSLAPLYTASSGEATRLARWGCTRNIQELVLSTWMRDRAQRWEKVREKGHLRDRCPDPRNQKGKTMLLNCAQEAGGSRGHPRSLNMQMLQFCQQGA